LSWSVEDAVWAWDPAAHGLVGVVRLGAWGDALVGLAVWSPNTTKPPTAIPNDGSVCAPIALSADRRLVVVRALPTARGFCDGHAKAIKVFDVRTSQVVGAPVDVGFANVAAFSRDGRYLAAGSSVVFVVNLQTHAVSTIQPAAPIHAIAMDPSQPSIVWATQDRQIETWKLGDDAPREIGRGSFVAYSPDGQYLAIVDRDLVLLDAKTLKPVNRIPLSGGGQVEHHTDAIAFSDDSRQIAIVVEHDLWVWQLEPVSAGPP